MPDQYQFGIEEEYFLADRSTGESPREEAADRFHEIAAALIKPASRELVKGQIEVQTKPSTEFGEARSSLAGMRRQLSEIANDQNLWLLASGSHPLAEARDQDMTQKERYQKLQTEFGIIAQRSLVCATHIHVEAPDPGRRIELINRLIPYLPVFYALSLSSPFWQGHDTGLKGFRLAAFAEWPRMGIPDIYENQSEYERFVSLLVDNKMIDDASFIWWFIRPATHYPTIELRICDSCTRLDDVVTIAALYQALMRALSRRTDINDGVGPIDRGVCAENIWQVQRRGLDAHLINPQRSARAMPMSDHLEEILDLVAEDAAILGSTKWVERSREILKLGTSADQQLQVFNAALADGQTRQVALQKVVGTLAEITKP